MKKTFTTRLLLFFVLLSSSLFAQAGTYYDKISTSSSTFIQDLQNCIRSPYQKWTYDDYKTTMIPYVSRDTSNGRKVITCVYSGENYVYTPPFAWIPYSREHTWCHSWMPAYLNNKDDSGPEYSDQHHLFPANQDKANGIRSNHPLGNVTNATYQYLEGKLGTNANSQGKEIWEPRASHKGDAARALLYMSLKYNGVRGDWTFNHLNSVTLPNSGEAPEDLNTLLEWNRQDPPDKWEVERNNYVQSIQLNRNPFVDHPEYVNYINFNDLTALNPTFAAEPENYPSAITANAKDSSITLKWIKPADGAQAPSGYLVQVFEKDNYFIPMDGAVYTDDSNILDGWGVFNVPASAGDSIQICKLKTGTTYYFTVYSYNGTGNQINYKIGGTVPKINARTAGASATAVYFTSEKATVNEGGTYQLSVSISDPSPVNPTTVEVAVSSGSAAYIGGFKTQTVTFPANSSAPQIITLNLTDDNVVLGTQTVALKLQNVQGGNFTSIKLPSTFTLSILDNDGSQQGGGFEDFANFPTSTSSGYTSGSFKGKDGSQWSYVGCYQNPTAPLLTPPFPVFQRGSKVISSVTSGIIQGGCGVLNFKYMQPFSTNVYLGVYVNDQLVGTVTTNNQMSVEAASGPITVNVAGPFTLKFQQIDASSGQASIDDVQWTGYGTSDVNDSKTTIPQTMYLEQSYPNPCNPEAVISYGLNENSHVSLKVYNTIGVEVASLVNGYQTAGTHTVKFNGSGLPSGIYLYRLEAGKYTFTRKLVLLK
ncbi:MAG TPA: endonuclease [Ignavibacteriales bacterium]|nr:endonuclease [Ignavibacteriales bacterium]